MFTGIVTEIGTITRIEDRGDKRMTIACAMDPAKIAIGATIACSGVCLTVVQRGGPSTGPGWSGRRMVRGRRFGRDGAPHRQRHVAGRARSQP